MQIPMNPFDFTKPEPICMKFPNPRQQIKYSPEGFFDADLTATT
jgi:hypothetical protein